MNKLEVAARFNFRLLVLKRQVRTCQNKWVTVWSQNGGVSYMTSPSRSFQAPKIKCKKTILKLDWKTYVNLQNNRKIEISGWMHERMWIVVKTWEWERQEIGIRKRKKMTQEVEWNNMHVVKSQQNAERMKCNDLMNCVHDKWQEIEVRVYEANYWMYRGFEGQFWCVTCSPALGL